MAQDFTVAMAGCVARVFPLYDRIGTMCAEYLTDAAPDFTITITPENIAYERELATQSDAREGIDRTYSDAYLETLAVHRQVAYHLIDYDALLFHGSAIAVDGEAYLFTALSGTGKSTHTRLWRQHFGDRAVMVNDDKPFVRLKDGQVVICGSPWDGKHRLSCNVEVPLKALCLLERGEENTIAPVSRRDALPFLLQQSFRPSDEAEQFAKAVSLLDRLTEHLPLYRLQCNMDPEAAVVAYQGMGGTKL